MPSDPPLHGAAPLRVYPTQFHPEFGYLAPQLAFRAKALVALQAAVFGALAGAMAVVVWMPSGDPMPVVPAARATSIAPADRWHMAPAVVSYVAPTMAMPVISAVPLRSGATASLADTPAPVLRDPPATVAATVPSLVVSRPVAQQKSQQKKKVARQPKREREARAVEPDPRNAYAGSVRRFAEPRRDGQDRRGFWNW
jgi:hypothetical protein